MTILSSYPLCILTWSSLCAWLCPNFLFLWGHQPTHMTSFYLITYLKTLSPTIVTFWSPGGQDFNIWILKAHSLVQSTIPTGILVPLRHEPSKPEYPMPPIVEVKPEPCSLLAARNCQCSPDQELWFLASSRSWLVPGGCCQRCISHWDYYILQATKRSQITYTQTLAFLKTFSLPVYVM